MFAPTLLLPWASLMLGCGVSSEPPPVATVRVSVEAPGASPEEVRFGVSRPLEEAIREQPDVTHVITTSEEGRATLRVQFEPEVPEHHTMPHTIRVRRVVEPMREMLPAYAELPLIQPDRPTRVTGFLLADPSRAAVVETALERMSGVQDIRIHGRRDGVEVQLDSERLAQLGLSIEAVEQGISPVQEGIPDSAILLKRLTAPSPDELGQIVLGEGLTLSDVATIRVPPPERGVTTGTGDPAVWVEVIGRPPLDEERPAGLVPVDNRVDLFGRGLDAALDPLPNGVSLVARSPVEATVYFTDEAAMDAAVTLWSGVPGVLVHPTRAHRQHLFVVAPDGEPPAFLASSSLPVVPLHPPPEPELQVQIDREKAAAIGVSTAQVAARLRLAMAGREVIPGVQLTLGAGTSGGSTDPAMLQQVRIQTVEGASIPIGEVATLQLSGGSVPLTHWNGLRVVPYVVTAREPLEEADVTAAFEAAGEKAPFWLQPM